jgi:hypothetical protein
MPITAAERARAIAIAAEPAPGERRVCAKRLRPGDRVLRSIEDESVGSFTVARIEGGYSLTAVGTDGEARVMWPTDLVVIERRN